MVENLYEKVKKILVTEWDKVAVNAGEVSWAYKDDIERYLDSVYGIPVNKSDPIISKLRKAGVIDYIDTRRGEVKCILGRVTRKQMVLYSFHPIDEKEIFRYWDFNESTEATIGFSTSIGISIPFQVVSKLKELCPEFDTEKETRYSKRRRPTKIRVSKDRIVIEIARNNGMSD